MAEQQAQHEHKQGQHPRAHSENEAAPSHGISINFPDSSSGPQSVRPQAIKHVSAPAYHSPIRHHRRVPSKSKGVKETLNARSHYGSSDDDGSAVHRINQYIIKQEIGRGSFGAVHLAVDQYGNEYAVKEFSKSRLRKRAQSNLLRRPNKPRGSGQLAAGLGFNSPLHRLSSSDKMRQNESMDSLALIKEEIAIMKKLNHNNLVCLIEVLDDPQEDSLYMVLEMCKKGVVMKVGLDDPAEPYDEEACRCWFRDMMLGMEYLHAQGIIHRDIKPDNCLITSDDVLKIVDFGVSEMFEKQSDMATAKSAGSPAFMPPELCVAQHGQVSGKAADIWSMGVTLYCLRYGHIPFEKTGMLELYESIRNDNLPIDGEPNHDFEDLMRRILDKNPDTRITMEGLREHPWITKGGADPLLSAEENCADLVDPPTESEMNHAITGNMGHLMIVMKAVKRFKHLLFRKRPDRNEGILGGNSRLVAPPQAIRDGQSQSVDAHDRKAMDKVLVTPGEDKDVQAGDDLQKPPRWMDDLAVRSPSGTDAEGSAERKAGETEAHLKQRLESHNHHSARASDARVQRLSHDDRSHTYPPEDHAKGHAHDPLTDTLFLDIGANADEAAEQEDTSYPVVSESPPAVDTDIYEQAYQDEMKRIMEHRGQDASMYLTRRVEHSHDIRSHSNIVKDATESAAGRFKGLAAKGASDGGGGLATLVEQAKEQGEQHAHADAEEDPPLQAPKLGDANEAPTDAKPTSEPPADDRADDSVATKAVEDAQTLHGVQESSMPATQGSPEVETSDA